MRPFDQGFISQYWLEQGKKIWERNSLDITAFFYGEEKHRAEVAGVRKLLSINPDVSMLDLACGTGRLCKAFSQQVRTVVGVDISPDFIAALENWQEKEEVHNTSFYICNLIKGDLFEIVENRFDIILLFGFSQFILHDHDLLNVFRKSHLLLKPGGRFLVKQTTSVLQQDVKVDHFSEELRRRWMANYRSVATMQRLLSETGFVMLRLENVYTIENMGSLLPKIERWADTRQKYFLCAGEHVESSHWSLAVEGISHD